MRDKFDTSILLIEHDMKLVIGICERLTELNYGSILAEGDPRATINDERVVRAYLGGAYA